MWSCTHIILDREREKEKWDVSMLGKTMSASAADLVVADPTITRPVDLAGALFWARKQNAVLHRSLNMKIAELAHTHVKNEHNHTYYYATPTPPCQLIPIPAVDGAHFETDENGIQAIRLDGIEQNNISEKFSVHYCAEALSGIFRIQKHKLCREDAHFSDDDNYSKYVRQHIGPDDFILGMEGPEIHDLFSGTRYLGQCIYEVPFKVSTAGRYNLKLTWWRENFGSAVDIAQRGWQAAHFDLPLGIGAFVSLEDSTKHTEHAEQEKPQCNLRDVTYNYMQGMWAPKEKNYDSNVIRIGEYRWYPENCALKQFDSTAASQCLAGKKVLLIGDSHMRQLRNSLVQLACGITLDLGFMGCITTGCPGLEGLCVIADGLAGDTSFMLHDNVDLVIANFGHHWIDGERRRTVTSYKQHVDTIVDRIRSRNSTSLLGKLVWYENNAMYPRKDAWIQGYSDQRTNVKIRVMNEYANAQMKMLGIPIIPAFSQTMAVVTSCEDIAHFDLSILQQSVAQFVLGLLCPN